MNTLTVIIDSRGAVHPFLAISNKLTEVGIHAQMYVSADLTPPANFTGALHDSFDTTLASEQHPVFASEQSTLKLLWESRKIIGQWIPHVIETLQNAIESGEVIPEQTVVIGNSPTFLYLGHFLLAVGFKRFITLEPYRMVDWRNVYHNDKLQMVPPQVPWVARALFASHGNSLTKKHYKSVDYKFPDIRNAVIAQAHTYSPLLCKDKNLALGYPYPDGSKQIIDPNLLKFIEAKKASGKKIYFLTFGSMQLTAKRQAEMAAEFKKIVHAMDAAAIVQGDVAQYLSDDEDIFGVTGFVAYQLVFPLVDLIFHHYGAGTLHLSLYAGKPSFAIPFLPDQYQWSKEADRVGIRVGEISAKSFNAADVIKSIQANYNQKISDQAEAMGEIERTEHSNGLGKIAEFVLKSIS